MHLCLDYTLAVGIKKSFEAQGLKFHIKLLIQVQYADFVEENVT